MKPIDLENEKEEHERQLRQLSKSFHYSGKEPWDYIDDNAVYDEYDLDTIDLDDDPEWDTNFWRNLFRGLFRSIRKGSRSRSSWGWLFVGFLDFLAPFLLPILWGKSWFLREVGNSCRPIRLARIMYRLRRRHKAFFRITQSFYIQLRDTTRVIDIRSKVKTFSQQLILLNDDKDSDIVNSASAKYLHVEFLIIRI